MTERLNIAPGSTVLDVGAGTGVLIPILSRKSGRLVALDFAEGMLRRARAKGFNGNIEYLIADVARIPVCDNTFDVTVCYSCFPHFHDKLKALAEIKRVTRKDGRLFICHTSSRHEINAIHCQVPALADDLIPERDEMQRLLSTAGFVDIRIEEGSESYFVSARKP
jgi:ubiquinone/menaquinone biosynthesis C-methylase UbiE